MRLIFLRVKKLIYGMYGYSEFDLESISPKYVLKFLRHKANNSYDLQIKFVLVFLQSLGEVARS